uniref:F-box only protein 36b isoform X2 n=1 Tax=Scatophagus argus TaxID=75038 RepID=UPI001ED8220B|nr:F-box only protein 36b isoform X2 [Scatophagus argus]
MSSLLTDPLFEISGRAPPPSKNFYYFAVTKSDVIWRWWIISIRTVDRNSKPGQLRESHQDFLDDTELQSEIINYLQLEDVGQLGRTSHRFRKLCSSEEFWEQAVRQRCNTVSAEVASLALVVGWRNIFFTSKLQLQKLISRRRLNTEEQREEHVSDPDRKAEKLPNENSDSDQF